jgi:putative membrane protein
MHQGPLARRFGLADLVLHTTAGPVAPRVIQADLREAQALFDAQSARARAARRRQTSEQWLAQVAPELTTMPVRPTTQTPQQEGQQRG